MKKKWINTEPWQACAFQVNLIALAGKPCYMGMDLSASDDIMAVALCFPPPTPKERYQFLYRFFLPVEISPERAGKQKIPYDAWIKKGLVIATPGNVLDYEFITKRILEDALHYRIREIAFDPWDAHEIATKLTGRGFKIVPIRQTFSDMAGPTDFFKKKILAQTIAHNGNPVMNWMISCTELKKNKQGKTMPKKPNREKSDDRIEGVVASIIALGKEIRTTES